MACEIFRKIINLVVIRPRGEFRDTPQNSQRGPRNRHRHKRGLVSIKWRLQ